MRKVSIAQDVESSILGFGCAPVLGAVGAKVADRALNVALDGGVTHFDVARSYGYGEAEAFLGKFFAGRREDVVIASKFGIRSTWKAGLFRPLKPVVRALKARRGTPVVDTPPDSSEPVAPPRKDHFHERISLTPETMMASLHQSLKALRTDYLDVFFIHEPTGNLEHLEPLMERAETLKEEGKIRAWGLSMMWKDMQWHASYLDRFDLLQFDNSPEVAHYLESVDLRKDAGNVFFSPFRARRDLSHTQVLNQLWQDFPSSVVLCSMFDPKHIQANIETARRAVSGQ